MDGFTAFSRTAPEPGAEMPALHRTTPEPQAETRAKHRTVLRVGSRDAAAPPAESGPEMPAQHRPAACPYYPVSRRRPDNRHQAKNRSPT